MLGLASEQGADLAAGPGAAYTRRPSSLGPQAPMRVPPSVHRCECASCRRRTPHPARTLHAEINPFASRLDEHQRHESTALEAGRIAAPGCSLKSRA